MYSKIVEREVLDAFVAFLRAKDIDTSDFEERQSAILNYGVIVSGGSVNAQSLAVGDQARATSGGARAAAANAARKTVKAAGRTTG